jgi:hypothetical protein
MWTLKDGQLIRKLGPYTLTISQNADGNYVGKVTDGVNTKETINGYQTIPFAKAATLRAATALAYEAYKIIRSISWEFEGKLHAYIQE